MLHPTLKVSRNSLHISYWNLHYRLDLSLELYTHLSNQALHRHLKPYTSEKVLTFSAKSSVLLTNPENHLILFPLSSPLWLSNCENSTT